MDAITQIKQKLNIVDIIGGYIELKKSGRNYKGVCPFHVEKTPSFMVSSELQIFKCFGCGENGDIFKFLQKIEGLDFHQALSQLADKAGVKIENEHYDPNAKQKKLIYEINEVTCTFFEYLLNKHPVGKEGLTYLEEKRKLSTKTSESFRVGFAPEEWDLLYKFLIKKGYRDEDIELAGVCVKRQSGQGFIDKFRGRIMFPLIKEDGKVVGFTGRTIYNKDPKYLNSPETLVFQKSHFIYGLDKAKIHVKKAGAIFVEGQMDVISAHQAGMENVVSSSGTSITEQQLRMVSRYTEDVIFCFDSDTAGQSATLRAIELAEKLNLNVKTVIIPKDVTDLDELIKNDVQKAKRLLTEPIPIYDYFLSQALKSSDKNTALGKKQIIETLIPKFAKIVNKVILEHYTKQLAQELALDASFIRELMSATEKNALEDTLNTRFRQQDQVVKQEDIRTEEYMLALLFSSKLELAQNILYKLAQKDFVSEVARDIFTKYKAYVLGRKKRIDIKYFIGKLENEVAAKAQEIQLIDLRQLTDNDVAFEKEIESIFKRLKKETINRELNSLYEDLKKAELSKNSDEIESLSQKVYKVSKLKKQYD